MDSSFLWSVGYTLLLVVAYGGIIGLVVSGVYFLIRFVSKPMARAVSHFTLVEENKSVSRLLPPHSRPFVSKGIKNEEQLAQLVKSIAATNGWKTEDVASMPVWLLTGHIVVDANPNLPFEFSKHDDGYRETDMN